MPVNTVKAEKVGTIGSKETREPADTIYGMPTSFGQRNATGTVRCGQNKTKQASKQTKTKQTRSVNLESFDTSRWLCQWPDLWPQVPALNLGILTCQMKREFATL